MHKLLIMIGMAALSLAGCRPAHIDTSPPPAIVGAWIVKIPEAPFALHMFVFHSDGTVEQSNPDAGDPVTSDSNLMGAWMPVGGGIKGKVVEITADRTTHRFSTRGQVSFELKISGDTFDGVGSAVFFGTEGQQVRGPLQVRMTGERVLP